MAEEKVQGTVWVQAWTAKVPGSVAVEKSVLAQVAGLENLLPLVPMLVQVTEKEWQLAPAHLVKDSVLLQESDLGLEPWKD